MLTRSELKKLIEEELKRNKSAPTWQGKGYPIARNQWGLDASMREEVNDQGVKHGCHTCLTKLEVDSDQPWIGDHIPPTELKYLQCMSLMSKDWDGERYLFPQCHTCSGKQSALVRALKNGKKQLSDLTATEKKLLGKGYRFNSTKKCVESSGPKVTQTEGVLVQDIGSRSGCHSCGAKVPVTRYHADHTFPQEFCTHYMEELFAHLGLEYPKSWELRPQCPRCSGNQGGNMKKIRDEAIDYCRNVLNMTIYKF